MWGEGREECLVPRPWQLAMPVWTIIHLAVTARLSVQGAACWDLFCCLLDQWCCLTIVMKRNASGCLFLFGTCLRYASTMLNGECTSAMSFCLLSMFLAHQTWVQSFSMPRRVSVASYCLCSSDFWSFVQKIEVYLLTEWFTADCWVSS